MGSCMLGLKKQWPFWISGVFVGVAEIMNYIVLEKPVGLTTGLMEMTAAFEQTVAPGIDWWSCAYDPNVHWIIIGVLVTGLMVWSVRRGMRLTGFSFRDLMTHANDELTIKYLERYQKMFDDEEKGREKETGKPGLGDEVTEGA